MALRSIPSVVKRIGFAAIAIALPACSTAPKNETTADKSDYKDAIGVFSNPAGDEGMDPIAAAAYWGTRYNTEQANPQVAVNFSRALRRIGSKDEAGEVMQKAAMKFAGDPAINLEYGKVLVESGRAFEAVRYLEDAATESPNDWNALSAYGVALDQIGEHKQARQKYNRALSIAPGAISVMNNKGLSFAIEGDLTAAAMTLRQAAATTRAGGDARIRQNLALVLALSGDMTEAERLARSDLPPLVADNNVQFYRQLMNQPAYWGEYAASDVDMPQFDPAPAAPIKPAPAPTLREEPKQDNDEPDDGAPIALMEVAPVTNASATAAPIEDGEDE